MALLQTLQDSFTGPSIDSSLWTASGAASIISGELYLDAGSGGFDYGQIESVNSYDLTGSYAQIKVVTFGGSDFRLLTYPLRLTAAGGMLYWQYDQGYLKAYKTVGATTTLLANFVASSSIKRLRIRESGGTVYFDTAPATGTTWTNRASTTPGFTITAMDVYIGISWVINQFPTTMIVDDLNPVSGTLRSISGAILFGGSVAAETEHTRSISGGFVFGGSVVAIKQVTHTEVERKTYLYKVYSEEGTYLGLWNDVVDELNFNEEINTAGSSTTVELARNSDTLGYQVENLLDYLGAAILDSSNNPISTVNQSPNQIGEGSNVNYNNRVDVYVFYGSSDAILDNNGFEILDNNSEALIGTIGSPNGVRIYTGFISDISSRYGSTETTLVTLMSFGYDLDQYVVSSGSNTTVAFNSYDPSDIVRDGLDAFATASDSDISYDASTIDDTGTVVSYTFKLNTYLELLKKSIELAPSDWFFYLDMGSSLINFKGRPSEPDHYFHLGREIESLELRGNIEGVVNDVYFVGAETAGVPLYKRYTETPAARTRRALRRISDSRVSLEDTAELISAGENERNNQILYRSTLRILDKMYDIESIKLGQLIGFRNFGNYIDTLEMQIVGRRYTPEAVELQLGTLLPKVSKRVEDLSRNLKTAENENVPTAPA